MSAALAAIVPEEGPERETVKGILTAILETHGTLTPDLVVEEAREPSHPLHHRFDWDDSTAAESWRREQAAELIRRVRVTYAAPNGEEHSVRAFVCLREEANTPSAYEPVEKVLENDFTRNLLLRQVERELAAFKRKYGHLKEFAEMVRKILP